MDTVERSLDCWAAGGYGLVMHELKCNEAHARRKVRLKLRDYCRRTGDPIRKPRGRAGYAALRKAIM
jgi:hypothetical protein